jgi:hypothetical protein
LALFAQLDAKSLPGARPGGVGLTTALYRAQKSLKMECQKKSVSVFDTV